jgi:hypothetical protein
MHVEQLGIDVLRQLDPAASPGSPGCRRQQWSGLGLVVLDRVAGQQTDNPAPQRLHHQPLQGEAAGGARSISRSQAWTQAWN